MVETYSGVDLASGKDRTAIVLRDAFGRVTVAARSLCEAFRAMPQAPYGEILRLAEKLKADDANRQRYLRRYAARGRAMARRQRGRR